MTTIDKIKSFQDLQVGWNYGEGVPASYDTVFRAINVLRLIAKSGFSRSDAFPGSNGEIAVTGYEGNLYVEVICDVGNVYSITFEIDKETVFDLDAISYNDLCEAMQRVKDHE